MSQAQVPNVQHSQFSEMTDEIDLMALIATIWRGKWWIALCAIIAILLGGYYAFRVAIPMYPATSVVVLESKEQQVVDIESVLSGGGTDQSAVNTEVEVLRSRKLVEKLVIQLGLINDPEFNETLTPPSSFSIGGVIRLITGAEVEEKKPVQIKNAVVDAILRQINVSNVRQALVFKITATTTNSEKSALIANTLAELYIDDQLQVKFDANEKASTFLSEKAAELKLELETSEGKIKEFNAETTLVSVESLELLSRQLKDLRERLEGLGQTNLEKQARLGVLRTAQSSGDIDVMIGVANDTRLDQVAQRLKNGTIGRDVFDAQFASLITRAELEATRASQQYDAVVTSEAALSEQIDRQSDDLVQLQQLRREAEANRLLYESFLGRLKETSVQKGLQQADSRILSDAVPRPASAPRKGMILVLSMMLGVFAGAGLVLLNEMRHNAFRTVDELENYTNYGVLGSIPQIKGKTRKDVLGYVREKPASIVAEAVRNLRTSVLLSNVDEPPKVIMSTSSVPGEGKTTQSLTLAQNMAGLGKRVLVMEGDIRRRVFAEYFNLEGKPSFLSVIAGDAHLAEAVHHSEEMGVDILLGDKSSINAADIYASERFANFMTDLRAAYDYIIIDTPPVLAVPDARVIGQHVDAIVYTVLWNSTTKTQVKQGLAMFESVGLRVSGLVLGQVDNKQMKRYGYGGQYGYDSNNSYYDQ